MHRAVRPPRLFCSITETFHQLEELTYPIILHSLSLFLPQFNVFSAPPTSCLSLQGIDPTGFPYLANSTRLKPAKLS